MLDAYGLIIPNKLTEERRIALARQGYETDCSHRGISSDWQNLDCDTRYLWVMTADALIAYGEKRDSDVAFEELQQAGSARPH